jgi:hypothetical protein
VKREVRGQADFHRRGMLELTSHQADVEDHDVSGTDSSEEREAESNSFDTTPFCVTYRLSVHRRLPED